MSLANCITTVRILLVPVFVGLVVYGTPDSANLRYTALAVFCLAVLTDALDGVVARLSKQKTKLGTFLDPLADKLLLLSAFLSLYFSSMAVMKPPAWILVVIVSRDIFVICGLVVIFFVTHRLAVHPSMLGKIATVLQMATIIAILADLPGSNYLWNITAFFTVLSFVGYLIREGRNLNENQKQAVS
jgi:CDP-diacylglycerol--glycerol-3-phosphate 3-phosphatidyltransferase